MRFEAFRSRNKLRSDLGSGVVGFVLVAPLLVLVFVSIGQIAMLVADKSVLNSAAVIGARTASAADATNYSGRTAALAVLRSRGTNFDGNIAVTNEQIQGIGYVRVTVSREVRIKLLNRSVALAATARAINEKLL